MLTSTCFVRVCVAVSLCGCCCCYYQCGCDYTASIKGIGPHTALKLIKEHHSIEAALKHVDTTKHKLPEPFPYKVNQATLASTLQESNASSAQHGHSLRLSLCSMLLSALVLR